MRDPTTTRTANTTPAAVILQSADYVTIRTAASMTGLSEKAIRRKIEEGKWVEGREYRRSPDGGIFVSIRGFARWVEQGAV
jgi:NaMN:DMB phosphoribosyltransferase